MKLTPARRLAAAVAITTSAVVGLLGGPAPQASATDCTSNSYVVASVPLVNNTTNVASWNYGYVQLWYSNTCQTNWSRVVSLVPGTTWVKAEVMRSDYADAWASSTTSTVVVSGSLYSPVLKDDAYGYALANNTYYTASTGWY